MQSNVAYWAVHLPRTMQGATLEAMTDYPWTLRSALGKTIKHKDSCEESVSSLES